MQRFTIRHTTTYRYHRPVRFERHRLMVRPRDSHDIRIIDASLAISVPSKVNWVHDVFSNSIALVDFEASSDFLEIESRLTLERYARNGTSYDIAPEARLYPFVYGTDDRIDLGRMTECHYENSIGVLSGWLDPFVRTRNVPTLDLLADINHRIHASLTYEPRYREGTQSPKETLERGSGTCRDFAVLLLEGARYLGFGARFLTGYLYDPANDRQSARGIRGAQSTHAWAEIYIPGPGWVEFDPTNDLIDSPYLIRVAVTRDASQALPISGTYVGTANDFAGLAVGVEVSEAQP
ncbi:MAG: transglutaminase family protein [Methylobacteriaceae bacterium]|nr:transglutaminase family protein [Methylobacteriaceae bacterium]MBV9633015.1 transglutaminase family protein [Methylobacteriaceae bacterium]MBV9703953.1 transglutaminase family protein [Methylobacteriaceae bacterium]